ncbi:hypothetical protein ABTD78_21025, partial [Acinetobacter baumannii]
AELTQAVIDAMKAEGILAGNFYWYANNWHYIRTWDHLKQAITLNRISDEQEAALKAFQHAEFPISDAIMSRCISTAISLVWTDEQIK